MTTLNYIEYIHINFIISNSLWIGIYVASRYYKKLN